MITVPVRVSLFSSSAVMVFQVFVLSRFGSIVCVRSLGNRYRTVFQDEVGYTSSAILSTIVFRLDFSSFSSTWGLRLIRNWVLLNCLRGWTHPQERKYDSFDSSWMRKTLNLHRTKLLKSIHQIIISNVNHNPEWISTKSPIKPETAIINKKNCSSNINSIEAIRK